MEVGKAHSSIWPSVVCMSSCSSRCCPSLGLPCWPLLPASPVSPSACCSCVCAETAAWVFVSGARGCRIAMLHVRRALPHSTRFTFNRRG